MKRNFVIGALSFLFLNLFTISALAEVQQCAVWSQQYEAWGVKPFPKFTVYRSKNFEAYNTTASAAEASPAKAFKHLQKLVSEGFCKDVTPKYNCSIRTQVFTTDWTIFSRTYSTNERLTYFVLRQDDRRYGYSAVVSPYRSSASKAQQDLKELRRLGFCR